jgi:hypothetical protein
MGRTVTATVSVNTQIIDHDTTDTLGGGVTDNINENRIIRYDGEGSNTALAQQWTEQLPIVASTPQTLDLTDLPAALGGSKAFTGVSGIQFDNTGAHPIVIGNAGSNPFAAGWSAGATFTLPPNSRALFENNGTAWPVDSTHKNLLITPDANNGTLRVLIWGS